MHARAHTHTHTHTAPNTTHSDADMNAHTHTHRVKPTGTSESLHMKHNFTSKDSDILQTGSHCMKMTTDLLQSPCHEPMPCLGSLLACWTEGDVLCTQLIGLFISLHTVDRFVYQCMVPLITISKLFFTALPIHSSDTMGVCVRARVCACVRVCVWLVLL